MTSTRSAIFVNITAALFIFLFSYTAINKLMKITTFKYVLSKSPLIGKWAGIIAWSIIFLEWLSVLLLLYPPFRMKGLWLCLLLMSAFTIYIGIMLASSSHLPCSCGGILKELSWRNHFYLNIVLTTLAALALLSEKKNKRSIIVE